MLRILRVRRRHGGMPACLAASLFVGLMAATAARAGGDLVHPPTWKGSGCGPRYWGAQHEEGWCPDPCDSCNRWVGHNGAREMPDLLAPWQMAPGRGFRPPEQFGWVTQGPCDECSECGPRLHRWWKGPDALRWWR